MSMPCPECGETAHIRTSRPMSALTREQYLHCTNERCQHVFVAMLSITRTVGETLLPKDERSGWPFGLAVPKSRRYAQPQPPPPPDNQMALPGMPAPAPAG